ncbi:hypothetical protein [Ensifer canadensis]|uniref:hypothetical protein n=1 Tax=Ensifer canadensis TaxID=555315 RepID=UPI0035E3F346
MANTPRRYSALGCCKGSDAEDLLFRKVELQKLAMSVNDAAVFEERDTLMRWNYVA